MEMKPVACIVQWIRRVPIKRPDKRFKVGYRMSYEDVAEVNRIPIPPGETSVHISIPTDVISTVDYRFEVEWPIDNPVVSVQ